MLCNIYFGIFILKQFFLFSVYQLILFSFLLFYLALISHLTYLHFIYYILQAKISPHVVIAVVPQHFAHFTKYYALFLLVSQGCRKSCAQNIVLKLLHTFMGRKASLKEIKLLLSGWCG